MKWLPNEEDVSPILAEWFNGLPPGTRLEIELEIEQLSLPMNGTPKKASSSGLRQRGGISTGFGPDASVEEVD